MSHHRQWRRKREAAHWHLIEILLGKDQALAMSRETTRMSPVRTWSLCQRTEKKSFTVRCGSQGCPRLKSLMTRRKYPCSIEDPNRIIIQVLIQLEIQMWMKVKKNRWWTVHQLCIPRVQATIKKSVIAKICQARPVLKNRTRNRTRRRNTNSSWKKMHSIKARMYQTPDSDQASLLL